MQFRRRPWLTLIGCVAASASLAQQVPHPQEQQTGSPAASDPTPSSVPAGDPAPLPKAADPTGFGLKWRGAPISASGSLSYDLRINHAQGESRTLQHLVTANMSAATYLYQPWFAILSGSLGLTMSRAQMSATEKATQDQFVTGTARLDMFPRSRFPFDLHYALSDSRVDSGLPSTLDFRSHSFGISQRFRPIGNSYSLSSSFNRREQEGAGFRDTQNLLISDFTTAWKHNDLSLGLSQSRAKRQLTGEQTMFRSIVARHSYSPGSELSLNTTLNGSQTNDHLRDLDSAVSVLQLSSVGLWHREGSKLTLNGGVRGLLLREAASDHTVDTFGLTLGASYELNRNARLTASGNANTVRSGTTRSNALVGSLGAGWQADTLEFGGLRYDWYASGSLGGSRSASDSQATLAVQLGHTLNRVWPLSEQSTFVLNAGQSLSATRNRSGHSEAGAAPTSSRALMHSAGATWTSSGPSRSAYARASYNDSMEIGGGNSRFQLLNFQLSGTFDFDRNRSLNGDLTLQQVRQRAGDVTELGLGGLTRPGERLSSGVASGEITYRQQRAFGVPRLRFVSRLKLAQDVLSQAGTLATIPDRETQLWENRLEWLVGRLETQIVFRISRFDGVQREFLMWRVQRGFGG